MNALDLAKYIINKCTADDAPISNLQLQKILYFIQVEFLKNYHEPAFNDAIEAWQFGPVVPSVYYEYCGYGGMKIPLQKNAPNLSENREIIENVIEIKSKESAWELVKQTHKPKGPWARVYQDGAGYRHEISQNLIRDYA